MKQIPIVLNENVQNQTIVKICFGGFLMSTEGLERDQWHGIGSKLLNKNAELSRCNILWNFAWHRHGLIHLVLNGLKYSPYIRLIPNLTRFFLFLRLLWFIAEILSSKKLNLNVCIYIYIYIYTTPQTFWRSSAPGALSTLVTSVVLYSFTRATLMST